MFLRCRYLLSTASTQDWLIWHMQKKAVQEKNSELLQIERDGDCILRWHLIKYICASWDMATDLQKKPQEAVQLQLEK